MYIHVYTCIYMYIHVYTCIYMYIHIDLYMYMYIDLYVCVSMYVSMYVYMYMYICICMCTCTCTCIYVHMYTHICVSICKFTCLYMLTPTADLTPTAHHTEVSYGKRQTTKFQLGPAASVVREGVATCNHVPTYSLDQNQRHISKNTTTQHSSTDCPTNVVFGVVGLDLYLLVCIYTLFVQMYIYIYTTSV